MSDTTAAGRAITSPGSWSDAIRAHRLPPFDVDAHDRVVVVAAHPDDETLGAAGVLRALHAAGAVITLVVATDGEAAYPGLGEAARRELGTARRAELAAALEVQGLAEVPVHWLGLPDSALQEHADALQQALEPLLADADAYLAPWSGDPHPDHQAAGAAAAAAAPVTAHGWSYPIWTWAWTEPGGPAVPWERARVVALDEPARAIRRRAVVCFASQVGPGPDGSPPVLAAGLLEHVDRDVDLLFREPRVHSAPVERFTTLYDGGHDPWDTDSWYERRKRGVVLASLPRERYRTTFEPGCGTGELTLELAGRCRRVLASDPVPAAVERARRLCRDAPTAHVTVAALPDAVPGEAVDLVVFSEILYYLGAPTLEATLDRTLGALEQGGDVVVVHWRGWPAEAPRDAAATHRVLCARPELDVLVEDIDEEFLLHVLRRR
ncbi:PIG-L family deacetylase [Pseudonocardia xinjiangensis]|uniref:PIG-L family deacetylase n=1 Tax=Pseudonocardia xinjiangensis TaxID=75289 RepID=UPI003D8DD348